MYHWLQALRRRIQRELQWSIGAPENALLVWVSIDAAATSEWCSAQELLTEADHAMYRAKERGSGHFVISEPDFGPSLGDRPAARTTTTPGCRRDRRRSSDPG